MAKRFHLIPVAGLLAVALVGSTALLAQDDPVTFISTQFNVVEEADKFRTIMEGSDLNVEFVTSEEGPMLAQLQAEGETGEGTIDLIGSIHGSFPTLANNDLLFDESELLAEIEAENNISDAFVALGRMGTEDYQYYIPWAQATYVMAAHVDALEHLPEDADLNALTWEQLAEWGVNLQDATGEAQLGFPVAGLFHRALEGYLWPSFTGGMVTTFRSQEAADMLTWVRDELWPVVNPESINYSFMNEPLLAGAVMVAFDHVARLKPAFDERPDDFVAFPAPAGPAGRGQMPVVLGLAVPFTSPDPDGAEDTIRYLLSPEAQAAVLTELGFYPVIDGVDTSAVSPGVAALMEAVTIQGNAEDAVTSLLPVGLGDRGGEINEIFRNAFNRVVVGGEDVATVLDEEGEALQTLMTETGAACWAPDPASEGPCQVTAAPGM